MNPRLARAPLAPASLATAAVAAWLLQVTTFVLPAHDPARVPMWRAVAAALVAYSAVSWACLAVRPPRPLLSRLLVAMSAAALAAAAFGIVTTLRRVRAGGELEGYLPLMGGILAAHGLAGLPHGLAGWRAARPPSDASGAR